MINRGSKIFQDGRAAPRYLEGMERKSATLLRAAEIAQRCQWFTQRLNPGSAFQRVRLGAAAGLSRVGLTLAWIPPGQESFAYHAHQFDEEWIYILEGRGVALVDGRA